MALYVQWWPGEYKVNTTSCEYPCDIPTLATFLKMRKELPIQPRSLSQPKNLPRPRRFLRPRCSIPIFFFFWHVVFPPIFNLYPFFNLVSILPIRLYFSLLSLFPVPPIWLYLAKYSTDNRAIQKRESPQTLAKKRTDCHLGIRVAHDDTKIVDAAFESMPEVVVGWCWSDSNELVCKNGSVIHDIGAN